LGARWSDGGSDERYAVDAFYEKLAEAEKAPDEQSGTDA
jgi:hypothetical protein